MKLIVQIVLYTLALLCVDALFSSIFLDGVLAAVITACVLMVFNVTIKPLLHILSLPLTFSCV